MLLRQTTSSDWKEMLLLMTTQRKSLLINVVQRHHIMIETSIKSPQTESTVLITPATAVARTFLAINRQPLELESSSKHLQIQQVF